MSSCPTASPQTDEAENVNGRSCPVTGSANQDDCDKLDPRNMMPPSSQEPLQDQPFSLSKERQTSSIPKADSNENWVYPSQQMFFNAMVKKGWKWKEWDVRPEDMKHIIDIHNRNNEEAWQEVLKWEAMHAGECTYPKLVSFRGRSKDISPRARIRSWLGYELPFDRHDGVVDRCGRRVRYIIDYYGCDPTVNNSAPIYLDVRPAVDSFSSLWDRARAAWWRWTN